MSKAISLTRAQTLISGVLSETLHIISWAAQKFFEKKPINHTHKNPNKQNKSFVGFCGVFSIENSQKLHKVIALLQTKCLERD